MKLKRGTIREDGMVFSHYHRGGKERWITQEMLEKQRAKDKKHHINWRKENKDVVSERNKAWRDANPEEGKKRLREWRMANKERDLKTTKKWRAANPDKVKQMYENRKKDIQKFRFDGRVKRAKRRALLLDRLHPDHDPKIEKALIKQCQSLFNRFGIKFEIDHIVPLTIGGWHYHLNLHVIPMSLNRKKHNKDNSVLPKCWDLKERCKIPID
jgi:hypothetical protein